MIFVTVGTHTQQFNRLLQKIDELIGNNKIKEKIIAQIGNSTYKPVNYDYFKFSSEKKILEINKKAKLIISHAGIGNIITALQFKKPIIVIPRLKKFGEHINDHQIQIAKAFAKEKKVLACYNLEYLEKIIQKAKKFKPKLIKRNPKIYEIIKQFLMIQNKKMSF
ncbi:MAG: PssE/Cps14G family polysaccharide biosynthesis glycosyltransferase [Candidatus Aenigmatarchaeota archaeon]